MYYLLYQDYSNYLGPSYLCAIAPIVSIIEQFSVDNHDFTQIKIDFQLTSNLSLTPPFPYWIDNKIRKTRVLKIYYLR